MNCISFYLHLHYSHHFPVLMIFHFILNENLFNGAGVSIISDNVVWPQSSKPQPSVYYSNREGHVTLTKLSFLLKAQCFAYLSKILFLAQNSPCWIFCISAITLASKRLSWMIAICQSTEKRPEMEPFLKLNFKETIFSRLSFTVASESLFLSSVLYQMAFQLGGSSKD